MYQLRLKIGNPLEIIFSICVYYYYYVFLVLKHIPIVPQYQLNCMQQKKGGVVIVVWEHTVSGHGGTIVKDG